MSRRASFCGSTPVNSGCRVGDGAPPPAPEPDAAFHLLARSTCSGLRCHLYMHSHRFYPAGSKNQPSDTTSATTADEQQKGNPLPSRGSRGFAFRAADICLVFFPTRYKLWSVFREQSSLPPDFSEISTATLRDSETENHIYSRRCCSSFCDKKT